MKWLKKLLGMDKGKKETKKKEHYEDEEGDMPEKLEEA